MIYIVHIKQKVSSQNAWQFEHCLSLGWQRKSPVSENLIEIKTIYYKFHNMTHLPSHSPKCLLLYFSKTGSSNYKSGKIETGWKGKKAFNPRLLVTLSPKNPHDYKQWTQTLINPKIDACCWYENKDEEAQQSTKQYEMLPQYWSSESLIPIKYHLHHSNCSHGGSTSMSLRGLLNQEQPLHGEESISRSMVRVFLWKYEV